jgi:alkylation response protein AidB-like acyl-CoA dehydrogenase
MQLAFTEEQEELRRAARGFLADRSSSERVRVSMASELGWDADTWKQIGTQLGWTAVAIPEAHGGLGLGCADLVALLEEMGEALLCAPFFSTVCLAAPALLAGGDSAASREWLPAIAEGRVTATLVADAHAPDRPPTITARAIAGGVALAGEAPLVLDGHAADLFVVAARDAASGATVLYAVPATARGVERRALPTMDATRRFASVALRDVVASDAARITAPGEGEGAAALARAFDFGCIALAAEQVGGAQRCLDLSVEYAKQRVQFGRPIGGFQAIKHKAADMMVAVESARSAAYWAACVADEAGPDLARAASLAKAWASESYWRCAADALQIHGGVGFTWEYDVHLHLKRARSMESFLGTPVWHRERVAREILA